MKKELRKLNYQYKLKKQELNAVTAALNQAERGFNNSRDDSATDCCIFEIKTLRQRRDDIFSNLQSIDSERSKYGNHF